MTGIDRIKAKILDDARGIADENLNRARQEAERIIAEAQKQALQETENTKQAATAEAENIRKTMDAVSSLEEESACSRFGRKWWRLHLRLPLRKL